MASKAELLGISLAPAVTLAIVLGNVYVILVYISNPQVIFGLVNNAANFPIGLLTAIFTPDTTIFLGTQSLIDWYIGTAGGLLAFLSLFFVVCLDLNPREIASCSAFYGMMLIVVSVASNLISLTRGLQSVGPSTAVMTAIGLVLGFSLANSLEWIRKGRPKFNGTKNAVATFMSLTMTLALIFAASVIPGTFFYIAPKVDWVAHIFCFATGALASLLLGLRSPGVTIIKESPQAVSR